MHRIDSLYAAAKREPLMNMPLRKTDLGYIVVAQSVVGAAVSLRVRGTLGQGCGHKHYWQYRVLGRDNSVF